MAELEQKSAKERLLEVLTRHEQELKKLYPNLTPEIGFGMVEVFDGKEVKEIPLIKLNRVRGFHLNVFHWEVATPDGLFLVQETSYRRLNELYGIKIPHGKEHDKLLSWMHPDRIDDSEWPRLMRLLFDEVLAD